MSGQGQGQVKFLLNSRSRSGHVKGQVKFSLNSRSRSGRVMSISGQGQVSSGQVKSR